MKRSILVQFPDDIYAKVVAAAKADGVSIKEYVRNAIQHVMDEGHDRHNEDKAVPASQGR